MAEDHPQYKDRLFNFIFGSEENKAWTLSLYNAINDSNYTDPNAIEIATIREIMYLGMRNDVAFFITEEMNLYEHQATYNPNMPLRLMQYAGNLYEKYIIERKLNKYGKALIKLPAPKLVVFYNGTDEQEDETILKLSDSFPEGADFDIEVKVRMLNVNYGRNRKLLEACKPLGEYTWIVREVRKNKAREELDSAIDRAITDMPDDFVIKPFLMAHRAEVKGMLFTEYKEEEAMEMFKEEGRVEGQLEKAKQAALNLLRIGKLTLAEIAESVGLSMTEIQKIAR